MLPSDRPTSATTTDTTSADAEGDTVTEPTSWWSRTSTCGTELPRRCSMSRSGSRPARSPRCSVPTEPGRARWPAPSRDSSPRPPGRVIFDGITVTGQSTHHIRKLGLTYIPEGRGIFPGLSVLDNLRMAVAQEKRGEQGRRDRPRHRAVPRSRSTAHPEGRESFGWRATDACPGPRPRRPPAPHHRRRDVAGPGADRGGVGVPQPGRGGARAASPSCSSSSSCTARSHWPTAASSSREGGSDGRAPRPRPARKSSIAISVRQNTVRWPEYP